MFFPSESISIERIYSFSRPGARRGARKARLPRSLARKAPASLMMSLSEALRARAGGAAGEGGGGGAGQRRA